MARIAFEPQHEIPAYLDTPGYYFVAHVNGKDIYRNAWDGFAFVGRRPKHFHKPLHLHKQQVREMQTDHFWNNVRTVLHMKGLL